MLKYCECGCGGLAPICTQTDNKKGVVKGKSRRFIRGHNMMGMQFTQERRRKMSESHKDTNHSSETKQKIAKAHKGNKHSNTNQVREQDSVNSQKSKILTRKNARYKRAKMNVMRKT